MGKCWLFGVHVDCGMWNAREASHEVACSCYGDQVSGDGVVI